MSTMCPVNKKVIAKKSNAMKKQLNLKQLDIKQTPKLSDGGYVWAG